MSRKAPLGEHSVTSKKRLQGRLGGSRLLNPAEYISFTTMHHWASSTKLSTATKEPRATLLSICFIILYQFILLMIYRYSSIQCTDFYQLPTASNLEDKKNSWIGHLLVPIPLACSRLWDSQVCRIKKGRTQKKSRWNWSEKGRSFSLPFSFFPTHPPFLRTFHFRVFLTLSRLPTIWVPGTGYNTFSFKIRQSAKPVSRKWIYWHENKKIHTRILIFQYLIYQNSTSGSGSGLGLG